MTTWRFIYLDPPWRFRNWSMSELAKYGEQWAKRKGRPIYPVMTFDDMTKMPIGELGSRHSLMAMWTTCAKWDEALGLMKAYGYTYKTVLFVWIKLNPSGKGWHTGQGYHTRQNAEYCILGSKGNGCKRYSTTIKSLMIYPRGRHSAKPPIARERIEELYGDISKLEIYARQNYEGWDAWGNECQNAPGTEELDKFIVPPYDSIVDEDEFFGQPVKDTLPVYNNGDQMMLEDLLIAA